MCTCSPIDRVEVETGGSVVLTDHQSDRKKNGSSEFSDRLLSQQSKVESDGGKSPSLLYLHRHEYLYTHTQV